MSQPICRQGDNCDHGVPAIDWSPNVFVNNRNVVRLTDRFQTDLLEHPTPPVSSASPTVFINSKAVARIGDSLSCGSTIVEGSENVFSG
jgi:uncharacterized Zn-binding protein involved in type VI secretion